MIWSDHNLGGWGWVGMTVSMVVFWALVVALVVWSMRSLSDRDRPHRVAPPPAHGKTPEQLLAERFARGEIDEDEYLRRLAVLRSPPPPNAAGPRRPGPTSA